MVLKLGVATLSRVAKYYLSVAKVYQYCPISTGSLHFVAFEGHRKLKMFWNGCNTKKIENPWSNLSIPLKRTLHRLIGSRTERWTPAATKCDSPLCSTSTQEHPEEDWLANVKVSSWLKKENNILVDFIR